MNSAVFGSVAQSVDVLITGSGRLARAVAYSLATVRDYNIQVLLVARCSDAMKEVVTVARARATAFGSQIAFAGIVSDFASVPAMDDVMSSYRPRLILHTASLQSPWDITKPSTSRWADLVHRSGFGLTLPLQCALTVRIAEAIARNAPDALLINACYPDAVNGILSLLGYRIAGGIGNVDILVSLIRSTRGVRRQVKVVGHHYHVSKIANGDTSELPIVFEDDSQSIRADIEMWVGDLKCIQGSELNRLTGATAIAPLLALLQKRDAQFHMAGPWGKPGGYPVIQRNGVLALALPASLPDIAATAYNVRAAELDGVLVDHASGEVVFTRYKEGQQPCGLQVPSRWKVTELPDITETLFRIREHLT